MFIIYFPIHWGVVPTLKQIFRKKRCERRRRESQSPRDTAKRKPSRVQLQNLGVPWVGGFTPGIAQMSHEKKTLSIESWLVYGDPNNGLWNNPLYNWVGCHPLCNLTNHGLFHCSNDSGIPEHKLLVLFGAGGMFLSGYVGEFLEMLKVWWNGPCINMSKFHG